MYGSQSAAPQARGPPAHREPLGSERVVVRPQGDFEAQGAALDRACDRRQPAREQRLRLEPERARRHRDVRVCGGGVEGGRTRGNGRDGAWMCGEHVGRSGAVA